MKLWHEMESPNLSRARILTDSKREFNLFIEANVDLDSSADCWLFLITPVCMVLGENLEINGYLTQTALESSKLAMNELIRGHDHMSRIEVTHDSSKVLETHSYSSKRNVGLFYSGGVDSTFAAETVQGIDTLISVWGFDIPVKNERHWRLALDLIEPYANETGRKIVRVKTNIREISNDLLVWGRDYHGTALSGIATCLSTEFSQVYIAAGFVRQDPNWGHSPALFSTYSSQHLLITETEPIKRIAKANALGSNQRASAIRACYRNKASLANCSSCKKCVRTRLEFGLVDARFRPLALEKSPGFAELANEKLTKWDFKFYLEALRWARIYKSQAVFVPLVAVSFARFATFSNEILTELGSSRVARFAKRTIKSKIKTTKLLPRS